MIVYKVVLKIDRGHWCSAIAKATGLKLLYQIGKPTVPTVGKLFAFSNDEDAFAFADGVRGELAVFEASAVVVPQTDNYKSIGLNFDSFDLVRRFWDEGALSGALCPRGTVLCDYILPIKMVP